MAHGGGWADEPLDYLDAITAIESENNKIESEEIDSKSKPKDKKVDGKEGMKKAPAP